MSKFERFEETKLPSRDTYFNDLSNKEISEEDYSFAQGLFLNVQVEEFGGAS